MKRKFSGLILKEAMQLVPTKDLLSWEIDTPPRLPLTVLPVVLPRLKSMEMLPRKRRKSF